MIQLSFSIYDCKYTTNNLNLQIIFVSTINILYNIPS